jgi:hypothetical protein
MNNNLSKRKGKNNTKAKNGEELPEKKGEIPPVGGTRSRDRDAPNCRPLSIENRTT